MLSGFYPCTSGYSSFAPNIVFYSLLNSLSPWDILSVDSEEKHFKIQVSRLLQNVFPTLLMTAEA